jgi:hypothetical protein
MKKAGIFIIWLVLSAICLTIHASKITLTVHAGAFDREDCVVSAEIPAGKGNSFRIVLEQGITGKAPIPSQTVTENGKTVLYWILSGKTKAGSVRTFIAKSVKKPAEREVMQVEDTRQALILKKDGKPVLQYNYVHVEPPTGANPAFGRSGFLHPAWSPAGNILTAIQPKDHYHHYGIWNPWTHIEYDGKQYDLWNLGDKKGTVRAGAIKNTRQGGVFSGFDAELKHVIFTSGGEQAIMDERWNVIAWNIPGVDGFLWDFESHLRPSTPLPILLQQYRYAGFGYRATEEWTKDNCEMLTSEGKTRQEIDGTSARWIYVTGDTKTGRSGLLFMGHPENYNAPEPLRIWDKQANGGRGDVFINFAPTKNKDWQLEAGGHYMLRYRVLAYEGEMTSTQADRLWNDFAYPPTVEIK